MTVDKGTTAPARETLRLAALADLHVGRTPDVEVTALLEQMADRADVLLLCGDLTDHGAVDEARALGDIVRRVIPVPVVAVLGNHDHESARADEVRTLLADSGVNVLEGDSCEIRGVGFAGTKGFGGGFGQYVLRAWGEEQIKRFVGEAVTETLKLESALGRLKTSAQVVLLHYAAVADTVTGEPPELHPFLGCSRLEEPLSRYPVSAVFHGHAHRGRPEGRTSGGTPVYNVSLPLMRSLQPDSPFRLLDVPV